MLLSNSLKVDEITLHNSVSVLTFALLTLFFQTEKGRIGLIFLYLKRYFVIICYLIKKNFFQFYIFTKSFCKTKLIAKKMNLIAKTTN